MCSLLRSGYCSLVQGLSSVLEGRAATGDTISIEMLRGAIAKLPENESHEDPGIDSPKVWYRSQKEHWLGWLDHYHTPGAYGRTPDPKHDARHVYNHVVNPFMLLWLIESAGVDDYLVAPAREAAGRDTTLMARAGAIRKHVPWATVRQALF